MLITTPADCRGWYIDGGVRLNAPIKPAVALGANRVVVVSSHAVRYPPSLDPTPAGTPRPGLRDAAAQVLHAVLADAMVDDLHRLGRKNQRFQELLTRLRTRDQGATPDDAQTLTGYQCIPYLAVAPSSGQLADIATKVYEKKYGGLLSPPDSYWALGKLLRPGGDAVGARELLSYLFFDPTYAEAQVELGRQCAQDAIAQGWQTAPP